MLTFPEMDKWKWILAVVFLALLPLAFLGCQAWLNPDIQFLVSSFNSEWILHPPDSLFPGKLSGTVVYRRLFEL